MINNIIFDFDGVIVDSEVLASKAFVKYFNNLGYSLKEEQFYSYAGNKTVEVRVTKLEISRIWNPASPSPYPRSRI